MPASAETTPPLSHLTPPPLPGSREQGGQAQHLNSGNFGMCS